MTTNPPSEVKKRLDRVMNMIADNLAMTSRPIFNPKESPVSQSVEEWEATVDDILLDMCVNPDCPDPKEHAQYKPIIKQRILDLLSTTLSTLVKKMEGLKKGDEVPKIGMINELVDIAQHESYNAGISAAVEVVKKMV